MKLAQQPRKAWTRPRPFQGEGPRSRLDESGVVGERGQLARQHFKVGVVGHVAHLDGDVDPSLVGSVSHHRQASDELAGQRSSTLPELGVGLGNAHGCEHLVERTDHGVERVGAEVAARGADGEDVVELLLFGHSDGLGFEHGFLLVPKDRRGQGGSRVECGHVASASCAGKVRASASPVSPVSALCLLKVATVRSCLS